MHEYPESQLPDLRARMVESSRDGSLVLWPMCLAASWSTDIPFLILAPAVFFAWQPVRNVALALAWSPPPSPFAFALSWSSPLMIWISFLSGLSDVSDFASV